MKTLLAVLACMLAGCQSLGPSPEQAAAMALTSSSFCVETPGWNGAAVKAHYATFGGKSTGTGGGGGEATCGSSTVKFTNDGKAAPATPKPTN